MTYFVPPYFRIGCYLTVRNIILGGLDTASRSMIAFVHSSAESGIFGESGGAFAGFLGILNDDSLTELLREGGLFRRSDLYRLVQVMANAIPQAAR